MAQISLYERYHSSSKKQYKIIDGKNFTYTNILSVLNLFLNSKVKKVLDIGCGSGTISLYLASKDFRVKGIDVSKKAIKACRESAKEIGIKNVEFEICNFPDDLIQGKFDLIFFSEVIEHLLDDDLALKKIYNLLNPNGILFISTPSKNAPLYRLGMAKKFDKEVGHLRRYSTIELKKKLIKNGFQVKNVYKKEGILRNFLFLNPTAGKLIRFIKFFLVDIFNSLDNILVKSFGESQIIILAKKTTS